MIDQSKEQEKRIRVFFYGSFIRREIMSRGGLNPGRVEIARLSGYDISFSPHANIFKSERDSIYGILVEATHKELDTLYSMPGVSLFLPEAVVVELQNGLSTPALCYIPPVRDNRPADIEYLNHIIKAATEYGFPQWYLDRLDNFRR